jgi:outer membrane protein assembly factor BamE
MRWRLAASAAAVLALAGCSTVDHYVPGFIKPYKADVQQGNWLTQQQVEMLRKGMTREQVRFALGSPTLTSIFRADRWDYPYLFTPGNGKTEERMFTVYFVSDRLDRWAGDEQPDRQPFQTEAQSSRRSPSPAFTPVPSTQVLPTEPTVEGSPPPKALDPSAQPNAKE